MQAVLIFRGIVERLCPELERPFVLNTDIQEVPIFRESGTTMSEVTRNVWIAY